MNDSSAGSPNVTSEKGKSTSASEGLDDVEGAGSSRNGRNPLLSLSLSLPSSLSLPVLG